MPGNKMPSISYLFSFDKLAHAFIFAVQVFLLVVAFLKQHSYQNLRKHAVLLGILLPVLYGILIEFAQSFIPGRGMEFADAIADTSGCIMGWGLFYLVYKVN